MAIPRGYRFDIPFDTAFPQGLVLIGEVTPDNEYQTREDKAAGRPVRQKVDDITGKRQWKATVTDPDEPTAKRVSFEITFIADVQPVPSTTEVLPGMRPIELDGLTAEPRVAGNGEFKYQSYVYRATGFAATAPLACWRDSTVAVDPTGRRDRQRRTARQGCVKRAMDDGSLSHNRGAGREDLPTAPPVADRFGAQAQRPLRSGTGVRASDKSARTWEVAYRHYGSTWELTARSPKGDPAAARQMAAASAAVASAWRQIAAATTLPWWTLVALEAAASAFEAQAHEYEAREQNQGHDHG